MDTVQSTLLLISTVLGIIIAVQGIFKTDKEKPGTLRMALFSLLGGVLLVGGIFLFHQFSLVIAFGHPLNSEDKVLFAERLAALTLVLGAMYGTFWSLILVPWVVRQAGKERQNDPPA